ncbi:MAG: hypothetical protein HZB59_05000 [Ignavibacteriales bacterium]|nr:hypothetical protein [Ignavibacteriales bacterium]
MKKIINIILTVIFSYLIYGCSDEPPSVRVYNQHTEKANVQIKTANGNTINHNDVSPGTTTGYRDVAEGNCVATAVIQKDSAAPSVTFKAVNDYNYTVVVVQGNPSYLRIDSKSK